MKSPSITFKKDEVLVLLGAGASVDAGIPHSAAMVDEIESELKGDWKRFRDLYNYVRSAIYYADGIQGVFGTNVNYNIERLVVSLDELARREEHPLYPFIGAWNPRLSQVAGNDFQDVTDFRTKILEKLRHQWIEIDNYEGKAQYFKGLVEFQKELNFPLHVFTLNYDLCVERAYQSVYNELPERGFGKDRLWSHGVFDAAQTDDSSMYLYKLHGSIDWVRNEHKRLTYSDSTSKIKVDEGELIFGTTYKLQYVDPFLFLVYQLRRLSLEARLIIAIGYGFSDEHINGILKQALRGDPNKKIVVVTYFGSNLSPEDIGKRKAKFLSHVVQELGLTDGNRVTLINESAKAFLSKGLTLAAMTDLFPPEESLFSEVVVDSPGPRQ